MRPIVVLDYDPEWPVLFERLLGDVWPDVNDIARAVEHVSSTSMPELAAKLIIDMDVVAATEPDVPEVIGMANLGSQHREISVSKGVSRSAGRSTRLTTTCFFVPAAISRSNLKNSSPTISTDT